MWFSCCKQQNSQVDVQNAKGFFMHYSKWNKLNMFWVDSFQHLGDTNIIHGLKFETCYSSDSSEINLVIITEFNQGNATGLEITIERDKIRHVRNKVGNSKGFFIILFYKNGYIKSINYQANDTNNYNKYTFDSSGHIQTSGNFDIKNFNNHFYINKNILDIKSIFKKYGLETSNYNISD
jgi:hypothetical protein